MQRCGGKVCYMLFMPFSSHYPRIWDHTRAGPFFVCVFCAFYESIQEEKRGKDTHDSYLRQTKKIFWQTSKHYVSPRAMLLICMGNWQLYDGAMVTSTNREGWKIFPWELFTDRSLHISPQSILQIGSQKKPLILHIQKRSKLWPIKYIQGLCFLPIL